MTASDWIAIVSLIALVLGGGVSGVFALWQWHNSCKTRRAEFINQIFEKLLFDSELSETIYMIEYDKPWYYKFHGGSEQERKVDCLFTYLTYICYLNENKVISNNEFRILEYVIKRVCQSKQTQVYLLVLSQFSKDQGVPPPFYDLVMYMRNKVLTETEKEKFDSLNGC